MFYPLTISSRLARRRLELNYLRLIIASLLALCGLLCGCSNIASARIAVTADPLSVSLELVGPTPAGSTLYTLPSGATLSIKSTAGGTAVASPISAAASTTPATAP